MSIEEEKLLKLFDSFWFKYGLFTKRKPELCKNPDFESEGHAEEVKQKPNLRQIESRMKKSFSDQFLSSKDRSTLSDFDSSSSPDSVLMKPKLETILSGKEAKEFPGTEQRKEKSLQISSLRNRVKQRRKQKGSSRSMSELEFEELKGFMDLGFVFSDEVRDSRLVSIIPGLQRLGKNENSKIADEEEEKQSSPVSRPYLSEAWEFLEEEEEQQDERLKVNNTLMDWRIPEFGNEMELKDHLRFWAHCVASTVI